MNLSPDWVAAFAAAGIAAVHWSAIGPPDAQDHEIMEWAARANYVVFTHDLDFGALLAASKALGPSVVQVRAQDIMPAAIAKLVIHVLQSYQVAIESGAIIVIDSARARLRLLPIKQ